VALAAVFARPRAPDLVAAARAHVDGAEVELGLVPRPTEIVTLGDGSRGHAALVSIPTTRPDVAFFLVSSTSWK
jgi:hypothetical protein